jgi:hypothetical protein
VLIEASREPNRQPVIEIAGVAEVQPKECESLLETRRLSAILDVLQWSMGSEVFGTVVHASEAIKNRSDAGGSTNAPET